MLLLPKRTVFICDTYVKFDPTAEEIAETTVLAAEEIRRFGLVPKVALLVALELRRGRYADFDQDEKGAGPRSASSRRASRSTARCTATRRSRRRSAIVCTRAPASKGRRISW